MSAGRVAPRPTPFLCLVVLTVLAQGATQLWMARVRSALDSVRSALNISPPSPTTISEERVEEDRRSSMPGRCRNPAAVQFGAIDFKASLLPTSPKDVRFFEEEESSFCSFGKVENDRHKKDEDRGEDEKHEEEDVFFDEIDNSTNIFDDDDDNFTDQTDESDYDKSQDFFVRLPADCLMERLQDQFYIPNPNDYVADADFDAVASCLLLNLRRQLRTPSAADSATAFVLPDTMGLLADLALFATQPSRTPPLDPALVVLSLTILDRRGTCSPFPADRLQQIRKWLLKILLPLSGEQMRTVRVWSADAILHAASESDADVLFRCLAYALWREVHIDINGMSRLRLALSHLQRLEGPRSASLREWAAEAAGVASHGCVTYTCWSDFYCTLPPSETSDYGGLPRKPFTWPPNVDARLCSLVTGAFRCWPETAGDSLLRGRNPYRHQPLSQSLLDKLARNPRYIPGPGDYLAMLPPCSEKVLLAAPYCVLVRFADVIHPDNGAVLPNFSDLVAICSHFALRAPSLDLIHRITHPYERFILLITSESLILEDASIKLGQDRINLIRDWLGAQLCDPKLALEFVKSAADNILAARFEDDVMIYYAAWTSSIAQASATLATVPHLRDILQQQLTWLGEDEPAGARPGTDRRRQFRERVKEALLVLKHHGHDVLQKWAFRCREDFVNQVRVENRSSTETVSTEAPSASSESSSVYGLQNEENAFELTTEELTSLSSFSENDLLFLRKGPASRVMDSGGIPSVRKVVLKDTITSVLFRDDIVVDKCREIGAEAQKRRSISMPDLLGRHHCDTKDLSYQSDAWSLQTAVSEIVEVTSKDPADAHLGQNRSKNLQFLNAHGAKDDSGFFRSNLLVTEAQNSAVSRANFRMAIASDLGFDSSFGIDDGLLWDIDVLLDSFAEDSAVRNTAKPVLPAESSPPLSHHDQDSLIIRCDFAGEIEPYIKPTEVSPQQSPRGYLLQRLRQPASDYFPQADHYLCLLNSPPLAENFHGIVYALLEQYRTLPASSDRYETYLEEISAVVVLLATQSFHGIDRRRHMNAIITGARFACQNEIRAPAVQAWLEASVFPLTKIELRDFTLRISNMKLGCFGEFSDFSRQGIQRAIVRRESTDEITDRLQFADLGFLFKKFEGMMESSAAGQIYSALSRLRVDDLVNLSDPEFSWRGLDFRELIRELDERWSDAAMQELFRWIFLQIWHLLSDENWVSTEYATSVLPVWVGAAWDARRGASDWDSAGCDLLPNLDQMAHTRYLTLFQVPLFRDLLIEMLYFRALDDVWIRTLTFHLELYLNGIHRSYAPAHPPIAVVSDETKSWRDLLLVLRCIQDGVCAGYHASLVLDDCRHRRNPRVTLESLGIGLDPYDLNDEAAFPTTVRFIYADSYSEDNTNRDRETDPLFQFQQHDQNEIRAPSGIHLPYPALDSESASESESPKTRHDETRTQCGTASSESQCAPIQDDIPTSAGSPTFSVPSPHCNSDCTAGRNEVDSGPMLSTSTTIIEEPSTETLPLEHDSVPAWPEIPVPLIPDVPEASEFYQGGNMYISFLSSPITLLAMTVMVTLLILSCYMVRNDTSPFQLPNEVDLSAIV